MPLVPRSVTPWTTADTRTPEQKDTLQKLLTRLKEDYPEARVVGHRELPGVKKDCPCYDVSSNVSKSKELPESVFAYSLMPESDIAKIFRIINLDNSQITNVGEYVKTRNEMAHASGKFEIPNEESFDTKVHTLYISIKNIHNKMDACIRKWYEQVLLSFCRGEYEGYDNPKDVILEQMIQTFKLSVNELLVCNEMSVSSLITAHRGYQTKLKDFKKAVTDHCQEMGYI